MTLISTIEAQMRAGMITGVNLSLWSLRRLPGEPVYSATVTWPDAERDRGRGKGATLVEAFNVATGLPAFPMPPDEIEQLISELGYGHMNLGLSGLAPVDPNSLFFANGRLNIPYAPLKLGRGPTLQQAIERMTGK